MKTPYEILGVSPNASDDEIKKAYKALVKKYHPDKYRDSDLSDLATEKMKEINAAYEEIQKMRAGGGKGSGNGAYSGNPNTSGGNAAFAEIRRLIINNQIREADMQLRSMDSSMQNAEWHFLMGCICTKQGFFVDAQHMFDRACSMDPYNAEYKNARDSLRAQTSGFGSGYRTSSSSDTACNCCSNLICADCCCEMMGGDLISCC